MAEQKIKNNMDAMRNDIRQLDKALASLESQYKRTFEEIESLSAMWEGTAHNVLVMQFQRDAAQVENMIQFLRKYKEELNNARDKYIDCENRVNDLIRSI